MKKSLILSLFLLSFSKFASSANTCSATDVSFNLTLSEDKKAYRTRRFHIFYEQPFKGIAEQIKCNVAGTVKLVDLVEITGRPLLEDVCQSELYLAAFSDKLRMKDYMVTITEQRKYTSPITCTAINQVNLIKAPHNQWAVQIRGHSTEIVFPIDLEDEAIEDSLQFALDALFFASSYGFGESMFKSLGDGGFKEQLVNITLYIYILVVVLSVAALVILFSMFIIKRNRKIKKRESEKSNLLRNSANNNDDDTPVDFVLDEAVENKH